MERKDQKQHTYHRVASDDGSDSLGIIFKKIMPGQTVLDLGMGIGLLGKLLSDVPGVVADGVTYNIEESEIGKPWYRTIVVADLDAPDALSQFEGATYDVIVCADVIEHLKAPEQVLRACQRLLKPKGRLIVSVPNAGYCGLIAELIQGEFRYREEGLLDRTHLRFFTRKSLARFFLDNGWDIGQTAATHRTLLESEFKTQFDSLAPGVSRHLLALPDAFCYQFVWELSVSNDSTVALPRNIEEPTEAQGDDLGQALFSAQVFLNRGSGYRQDDKISVAGSIGRAHQDLTFPIAASDVAYQSIRLDPADRPGFFRVHHIGVVSSTGEVVWGWNSLQGTDVFKGSAKHQLALGALPGVFDGVLWMLLAEDPWLELPLPQAVLQQLSATGGKLTVQVGWPMSADYLQAALMLNRQDAEYQQRLEGLQRALQETEKNQIATSQRLQVDIAAERQLHVETLNAVNHEKEEYRVAAQQSESTRSEILLEKTQLVLELRQAQQDRNRFEVQFDQIARHVARMEQSRLFRATRPISHFKGWLDAMAQSPVTAQPLSQPVRAATPVSGKPRTVDIVVPVYKGLEDTQRCLASVLASTNTTPWRLVVIDDKSPEPELSNWLRTFASLEPRITLLANEENRGFVCTVNRGMQLNLQHDVVLLNSDAEVANDWLDRLVNAAASHAKVATVTPFSNNATIFSYPQFCGANTPRPGHTTAQLDSLFALNLDGQTLEVPTAVGFCMFIARGCLEQIGYFDEVNFGKGYGEENDFCVRASATGWKHLHALDTYVHHAGGVSFGESKSQRELDAMNTLRRLHPAYESEVHAFVQKDPARDARQLVDLARIVNRGLPVILNIVHDRQGGTLRHVQELAARLVDQAVFLRLSPVPNGVQLRMEGEAEAFSLVFDLPSQWSALLEALRALGIAHLHYHHLLGHVAEVFQLPDLLGVSHDFTAHDFYSYCPQISLTDAQDRYCGEMGLAQCTSCLASRPAPYNVPIEQWRGTYAPLLARARTVIAPSHDSAARLSAFVPAAHVVAVPHEVSAQVAANSAPVVVRTMLPHDRLKVVVLGALSKIKGADVLESVAALAAKSGVALDFHLLGYGYRHLQQLPKANLIVHGQYEEADLHALIAAVRPDVIWFPALWPETYSYTLSAALASAVPLVVPNLGAFEERVGERPWVWQGDWNWTPHRWLSFFEEIRQQHFLTGVPPKQVTRPKTVRLHTADSVAEFSYERNYLAHLVAPVPRSTTDLWSLHQQLTAFSREAEQGAGLGRTKGAILGVLTRFRRTRLFSSLVRLIPSHYQRRIKSWLAK